MSPVLSGCAAPDFPVRLSPTRAGNSHPVCRNNKTPVVTRDMYFSGHFLFQFFSVNVCGNGGGSELFLRHHLPKLGGLMGRRSISHLPWRPKEKPRDDDDKKFKHTLETFLQAASKWQLHTSCALLLLLLLGSQSNMQMRPGGK